jgi:DNA repair protein RAD16
MLSPGQSRVSSDLVSKALLNLSERLHGVATPSTISRDTSAAPLDTPYEESDFEAPEALENSELSELSSYPEDSDYDSALNLARGIEYERKLKAKGKGRARPGTVGKSIAKQRGRRLEDGAEISSEEESDADSQETLDTLTFERQTEYLQKMRDQRRRRARKRAEARRPIIDKERKLKLKIGRKLTQGEKNMVALSHVSTFSLKAFII